MSLWDQLSSSQKTGLVAGGVLVVMALTFLGSKIPPTGEKLTEIPVNEQNSPTSVGSPAPITEIQVYVAGAVRNPGVYRMNSDLRVVDAIDKAGGMLEDADELRVNLAEKIKDGMQITVPFRGLDLSGPPLQRNGTVSLNMGTLSDFESLPDIGPVLAEAIVRYREENGAFQSVEDLAFVPGVGEKTLEKLRGQVSL